MYTASRKLLDARWHGPASQSPYIHLSVDEVRWINDTRVAPYAVAVYTILTPEYTVEHDIHCSSTSPDELQYARDAVVARVLPLLTDIQANKRTPYAIVTFAGFSYALGRHDSQFVFFNSHSCDSQGLPVVDDLNGRAALSDPSVATKQLVMLHLRFSPLLARDHVSTNSLNFVSILPVPA